MTTQLTSLLTQRANLIDWYYAQSDRFECVKEIRAAKEEITAQIEAIDAKLAAIQS